MPDGADVTPAEARLLRRVRINLALWSGGITLAVLVVLGLILYAAVDRSLVDSGTRQLEDRARELTTGRPSPNDDIAPGGLIFGGRGSGTFSLVAGPDGRLFGPRQGPVPDGLPVDAGVAAARSGGTRDIRAVTIADGHPVRVLTEPVEIRGRTVYLQVVGDRTTEQRTLRVLVTVLVVGGLVALMISSGVGAAYASRALVPIRRSLVDQREALRRQREFAADASHELRTPLTVIRASVEDLERHSRQPVARVGTALVDIRDEVDHLTTMVEDLLLLARSDSGTVELERVRVDLGDVASTGAAALSKIATERGVAVTVDPEPAEIDGDPARLRQLVTIMVDNAIRHSPAGASVSVRVRTEGTVATLIVDDEGPGIRHDDLPRLFDRFYRAAGAPGGGTGLGLAIAAWIVERHGGSISAMNRGMAGATFEVRLPLAGPGAVGTVVVARPSPPP